MTLNQSNHEQLICLEALLVDEFFSYFFQCLSEILECRYLIRQKYKSTTSSMSYQSVKRDHQDADRAKRSMKHDFET